MTKHEHPEWGRLVPVQLLALVGECPECLPGFRGLGDGLRRSMDSRTLEQIALRVSAQRDCLYIWRGHARIAHLSLDPAWSREDIARVATGAAALAGRDAQVVAAVDEVLE